MGQFRRMQVDAMLGLMRVAQTGDKLLPNLASVVLSLIEKLKEFEIRAGLAEAQLEDERAKVTQLQIALQRMCSQTERVVA